MNLMMMNYEMKQQEIYNLIYRELMLDKCG